MRMMQKGGGGNKGERNAEEWKEKNNAEKCNGKDK